MTRSPAAIGVMIAIAATVALLIGVSSVVGSYALTIHTIDQQKTTASNLEAKQKAVAESLSARAHAALCVQLIGLDDAKSGIQFSPPTKTGTAELYVLHLTKAIHALVVAQGCEK